MLSLLLGKSVVEQLTQPLTNILRSQGLPSEADDQACLTPLPSPCRARFAPRREAFASSWMIGPRVCRALALLKGTSRFSGSMGLAHLCVGASPGHRPRPSKGGEYSRNATLWKQPLALPQRGGSVTLQAGATGSLSASVFSFSGLYWRTSRQWHPQSMPAGPITHPQRGGFVTDQAGGVVASYRTRSVSDGPDREPGALQGPLPDGGSEGAAQTVTDPSGPLTVQAGATGSSSASVIGTNRAPVMVRLRDGLTVADGQRRVPVSSALVIVCDRHVAGNGSHGFQDPGVRHWVAAVARSGDLGFDHAVAVFDSLPASGWTGQPKCPGRMGRCRPTDWPAWWQGPRPPCPAGSIPIRGRRAP